MKRIPLMLFLGFLTWVVPFIGGMLIFPLQQSDRPLFESIMPIIITCVTVACSFQFFMQEKSTSLGKGITIGFLWVVVAVAFDSLFFLIGPFRIPFPAYVKDIAIPYLMIPVITVGFSCFSRRGK